MLTPADAGEIRGNFSDRVPALTLTAGISMLNNATTSQQSPTSTSIEMNTGAIDTEFKFSFFAVGAEDELRAPPSRWIRDQTLPSFVSDSTTPQSTPTSMGLITVDLQSAGYGSA